MRTRIEEKSNYKAIFSDGMTMRFPIDRDKPITELEYPEFYDIGINTICKAGCPWCYTSAKQNGINFNNVVQKIHRFFGSMDENQKPYQVAIGGSGEPTLHPDFIKVLEAFHLLDIVPNYTTNGMHLTDEIIAATKEYCGGVALSCHPHITKVWKDAANKLIENHIITNFHIIISDKESIDMLDSIYKEYKGGVDYFVLLPYMQVGRGAIEKKEIDHQYLEFWMRMQDDKEDLAFGANFHGWLTGHAEYGVSLYPPESMSKYLLLDDELSIYNNSFEMKKLDILTKHK